MRWRGMTGVRPQHPRFPWSIRSLFLTVGALSVACATARRPPVPREASAAVSALEPDASDSPVSWAFNGEQPARVEAVGEAASIACRFAAKTWGGSLRIGPELAAFVSVAPAQSTTVIIPEGDALQGARVSLGVLGVQLEALVAAGELDLYVKKPRFLDGYLWVGATSVLHWTRARAGQLAYRAALPARVSPAGELPSGEQACAALSVEGAEEDGSLLRAALGGQRSIWSTHWQGDERVPVTRARGRPPVAFLDTRATCASDDGETECEEPALDEVLVLEKRADAARIAYALETVVLVGWVPMRALQLPLEPHDTEELLLAPWAPWGPEGRFGAGDPTSPNEAGETVCAWNAPLAVETSGVMRRVGTLASGISFRPGALRQGWREVTFQHPALAFADDARAWVPERLLYPCQFP